MNISRLFIYLICGTLALGCGQIKKADKPLAQAHQDFLNKIHTEYQLPDVKLTALDKTIWIFIPFKGPLFEYKASPKSASDGEKQRNWSVNLFETTYNNRNFDIKYDIAPQNKYPKDMGYGSSYTDEFNSIYQKATTALREGYMDAVNPPEFIVLVIADITRGIKLTYTMYTEDFKYYSMGQIPQEEFVKRLANNLSGDQELIDDKEGKSIMTSEISMPEFLAKQITTRVNFKYAQSDFPPSDDVKEEILYQTNQTLTTYNFTDFDNAILHDLTTNTDTTVSKADVATHKDMPLPAGGKIHTINFLQQ